MASRRIAWRASSRELQQQSAERRKTTSRSLHRTTRFAFGSVDIQQHTKQVASLKSQRKGRFWDIFEKIKVLFRGSKTHTRARKFLDFLFYSFVIFFTEVSISRKHKQQIIASLEAALIIYILLFWSPSTNFIWHFIECFDKPWVTSWSLFPNNSWVKSFHKIAARQTNILIRNHFCDKLNTFQFCDCEISCFVNWRTLGNFVLLDSYAKF